MNRIWIVKAYSSHSCGYDYGPRLHHQERWYVGAFTTEQLAEAHRKICFDTTRKLWNETLTKYGPEPDDWRDLDPREYKAAKEIKGLLKLNPLSYDPNIIWGECSPPYYTVDGPIALFEDAIP